MGFLSRLLGKSKKLHGHDLIKNNERVILPKLKEFKNVSIIEIGSQRKAGSTLYLSQLSKTNDYHFITVDLNEKTTQAAHKIVSAVSPKFEAVNGHGELFLQQYNKPMHLVYLDAFDVDGDWHSDQLRNWYQSVGTKLNNENCWEMHLQCAKGIIDNMVQGGFVAFDDVNPVDKEGNVLIENVSNDHRKWIGKGTTAIPYMMDNGFRLISNQKGTALFQRLT